MYKSCSSNTEYMIAARFESLSNKTLLSGDSAGTNGTDTTHQTSLVLPVTITGGKQLYEVGTCTSTPTYAIATPASNDILDDN